MANDIQKDQVIKLVVGLFNAAPGKNNLSDLLQAIDSKMSINDIADFLDSHELFTKGVIGTKSNSEQVKEILSHFGLTTGAAAGTADKIAEDYFTGQIATRSWGSIVLDAVNYLSKEPAPAPFENAAALLDSKALVASVYSEEFTDDNLKDLQEILNGVTKDIDTRDEAVEYLKTKVTSGVTLTSGVDDVSGSHFIAPRGFTPGGTDQVNTLNDDDKLKGTGTDDVLDFTYVRDADTGDHDIVPIIEGVETVNVKYALDLNSTLDLQDSSGILDINLSRIDDDVLAEIENISEVQTNNLSINDSQAPTSSVFFEYLATALAGSADSVNLTLNDAQVKDLVIEENSAIPTQGFESFLLKSEGAANSVTTLFAEDVKSLKIEGDKDLNLGGTAAVHGAQGVEATHYIAGLGHVAGSLTEVNAEQLTGKLSYTIGDEINAGLDGTSGVAVNLKVTGGKGDDTFRLAPGATIESGDAIDGKDGGNTLLHFGGASKIEGKANVKGIKGIEIRTGHDGGAVPDNVTIDANAFDVLETILIRNEGQQFDGADNRWESVSEAAKVELKNLTETQANAITVAHGTTGNSNIVNNTFVFSYAKGAENNTATNINIIDGINADPVFNMQVTPVSAELVTFTDNDTESNTIHLFEKKDSERKQEGSTLTILQGNPPAADSPDPDKGNYMNFDRPDGLGVIAVVPDQVGVYDYVGNKGYGHATDGLALDDTKLFNNTTHLDRESEELTNAGKDRTRDSEVDRVFYGTEGVLEDKAAGIVGDEVIRHTFENVIADKYAGDVEIRLDEITRKDGTSSMNIKTGSGNDTFIFDAIGLVSAGFTSGDTINGGEGKDTLIIDGNTATIPGTQRIDHQTSEWDNLKGIDVLRFGSNDGVANVGKVSKSGGAYYAHIDDEFVKQTDSGNRLTVINNDGDLLTNSESDLVLDLRGLNEKSWITFQGANSNGLGNLSSNRVVLDNNSTNQQMILDGGDNDVRKVTTIGYVPENNNVLEIRNTTNATVSDLSQMSNFEAIEFTSDAATEQTLTMTLNSTIVEALVDSSKVAEDNATEEVLEIKAIDNGAFVSTLHIDARQVTGYHGVDIQGAGGADVIDLNVNIGGSAHQVDLAGSLADRINWNGGATGMDANIDLSAGTATFATPSFVINHIASNYEIVDLTALKYGTSTVTGTGANEIFIGGSGIDTFVGNGGFDQITGGAGADTVVYNALDTDGLADFFVDFQSGTDQINLVDFLAATGGSILDIVGIGTSALSYDDGINPVINIVAVGGGQTIGIGDIFF